MWTHHLINLTTCIFVFLIPPSTSQSTSSDSNQLIRGCLKDQRYKRYYLVDNILSVYRFIILNWLELSNSQYIIYFTCILYTASLLISFLFWTDLRNILFVNNCHTFIYYFIQFTFSFSPSLQNKYFQAQLKLKLQF